MGSMATRRPPLETHTERLIAADRARSAQRRIAVLDSGIGGLSVVSEIRAQLPEADVTYVADNAAFPYGNLADATVVERCERITQALLRTAAPSAVVIACNTATTVALPSLRARFDVPFVGCVPAIKLAAKVSKTRVFGLLATPATVRREYLRELIERFAADCAVITHGSVRLAALAERRFRGLAVEPDAVREELTALLSAPRGAALDTIVLGCTHYRFLLSELQAQAPAELAWIDPAAAVARRVRTFLSALPPEEPRTSPLPPNSAIFTGPLDDRALLEERLRPFGFGTLLDGRALPF
jgi:glutamate racemase